MWCISRYFQNKKLRQLRNSRIPYNEWHIVINNIALLNNLSSAEKVRLRQLTGLFLARKTMIGVRGIELTRVMQISIAAQACLLILNLGMEAYNGWVELVIYPGAFKVNRNFTDANGLVHQEKQDLSGESWERGPLILSWDSIEQESRQLIPGHNVIIHEFAHKLDMLNGRANGMPPLHPNMPIEIWTRTLSQAFETLNKNLDHFHYSYINPYASTNPAEFFAVISEYFFTAPNILHKHCPQVYTQLKQYYRQDTLQRFS